MSDADNLLLADGWESVDAANSKFYSRFPYPWPPKTFPRLEDEAFEAVMLNQSLGDFSHRSVPPDARVWVAGCGTNQAVYTALRFPNATIVGSDLSPASLAICERTALNLGVSNLTLRQESLNDVTYREAFDYIISTGVIHHTADPARVLANLGAALRPRGILELMVYNRFHRTALTAYQKAVRAVTRHDGAHATYDEELDVARALAATEGLARPEQLAWVRTAPESQLADTLIQPVEYTYTVESLNALAAACNLRLLLPCYNQFDEAASRLWTLRFATPALQERIDRLPDVVRWQVTNLLSLERSPMLWFFLCHRGPAPDDHYERRVNDEFLQRVFVRTSTTLRNYVCTSAEQGYQAASALVPYPSPRARGRVREVVERADGKTPMRQILEEVGVDPALQPDVTDVRTQTTTTLCPYLRSL